MHRLHPALKFRNTPGMVCMVMRQHNRFRNPLMTPTGINHRRGIPRINNADRAKALTVFNRRLNDPDKIVIKGGYADDVEGSVSGQKPGGLF